MKALPPSMLAAIASALATAPFMPFSAGVSTTLHKFSKKNSGFSQGFDIFDEFDFVKELIGYFPEKLIFQ
jgi:hypothetical protein